MKNYCSVSNDGNVFKKVDPSEVNKSDDEIMRKKKKIKGEEEYFLVE